MTREILDEDLSDGESLAAEGWHHVEVMDCRKECSEQGDAYYELKLVDARTGAFVARDTCMLDGLNGGVGIRKLVTIGAAVPDPAGTAWAIAVPECVVGMRAYVHVFHNDQESVVERRTRCAVSLKKGILGYLAEDDPPERVAREPEYERRLEP